MVSEAEPGGEEAEPQRGVDTRRCGVPSRRLGPKGERIGGPTSSGEGNECERGRRAPNGVDCEVPYRLERERSILYKVMKPLPSKLERESPKRTIYATSGLCTNSRTDETNMLISL